MNSQNTQPVIGNKSSLPPSLPEQHRTLNTQKRAKKTGLFFCLEVNDKLDENKNQTKKKQGRGRGEARGIECYKGGEKQEKVEKARQEKNKHQTYFNLKELLFDMR